jgi:hypothetical protein
MTSDPAKTQAIDCIGCERGTALGLEQKGLLSGLVRSVCFRGRSSIVSQFVCACRETMRRFAPPVWGTDAKQSRRLSLAGGFAVSRGRC